MSHFPPTASAASASFCPAHDNGGTVPLGEVASVKLARGPTTIRTENGQLSTYIYVDIRDRECGPR